MSSITELSFEELKAKIKGMSIDELRAFIAEVDALLPAIQEQQWVRNLEALENEILDLIERLRQETGRNYRLTLNGYPVQPRKR